MTTLITITQEFYDYVACEMKNRMMILGNMNVANFLYMFFAIVSLTTFDVSRVLSSVCLLLSLVSVLAKCKIINNLGFADDIFIFGAALLYNYVFYKLSFFHFLIYTYVFYNSVVKGGLHLTYYTLKTHDTNDFELYYTQHLPHNFINQIFLYVLYVVKWCVRDHMTMISNLKKTGENNSVDMRALELLLAMYSNYTVELVGTFVCFLLLI